MILRQLYTVLFTIALPFVFFRLWRKGAALAPYRERWRERLGKIDALNTNNDVFWFHTVSVGEFIAARPLIEHYITQDHINVVVTCMTPTGSERILETFGDRVSHVYLPYDIPFFINRFLDAVKPKVLVCLETELWPNILHLCAKRGVFTVLANARLSEKSATSYAKFASLTKEMLSNLSAAAIQNAEDKQRFMQLGLAPERAQSIGNIKFDLDIPASLVEKAAELKQRLAGAHKAKIIIAASTHKGEDELIVEAFQRIRNQHEHTRLVIVPRHPERFDYVTRICEASGFNTLRRSEHIGDGNLSQSELHFDILVGDTMGELLLLFGASDIAFIGGSFVNNGGHNYIEPAAWSLPLFSGTSTYNFREIAHELEQEGALSLVASTLQFTEGVCALLNDEDSLKRQGDAAKHVAERNRGALRKLIRIIDDTVLVAGADKERTE